MFETKSLVQLLKEFETNLTKADLIFTLYNISFENVTHYSFTAKIADTSI